MRLLPFSSGVLATYCTVALAATPAQWRSRAIYQVLTDRYALANNSTTQACNTGGRSYCGGSFRGIINNLDYIQSMGFTAIWISPVTLNFLDTTGDGTSYHGYWQQDLYRLNPNFGSAQDLKDLATALHNRGMYLMVDVVANHNGWPGASSSVDYTKFNPFNNQKYYHSYCTIDYNNQTSIEDCWLGDSSAELVDLKTEESTVASMYQTWIRSLVSNYSIDGLRIDTVKHVDEAFWQGFNSAAGVFCTGEVYATDMPYVCGYQNYMDSVLNYPVYYPLVAAFQSTSGSISNLVNMVNSMKSGCKDSTLLGSFSENHDNPRFASYTSDMALAQNVITFTLLTDGVPIIYEGQEQHLNGNGDPNNREAIWLTKYDRTAPLYNLIAGVNQARNHAIFVDSTWVTYKNWIIYSDSTTIAMRKGFNGKQTITVLSNMGQGGSSYTLSLGGHGWIAGTLIVEMLTCSSLTVDSNSNLQVPMSAGLPRIYYPAAQLTGSGICGR